MNTPEVHEDELHALIDGQLPKSRCTTVLAYLGRHPEEVARVAAYATQKEELRAHLEEIVQPTEDPNTAVLQQTLADRLVVRSRYGEWLRRAAAMAVLLGAGWWSNTLYQQHLMDRLPDVVLEAAQAHEIFSRDRDRPVELTAVASADLAAWFSSRLGELVEIPSLREMGLRLVGGRLLAGDRGPVAQLIYEDATGYRVSLCLSSESSDTGPELEVVTLQGLTAGYWHEGDLTYALVAKLPSSSWSRSRRSSVPINLTGCSGARPPNGCRMSRRLGRDKPARHPGAIERDHQGSRASLLISLPSPDEHFGLRAPCFSVVGSSERARLRRRRTAPNNPLT